VARGLFVTGTDTGVGKTIVSAALLRLHRGRSPVCYWKPIQTGVDQDDDTAEVARLAACAPGEILDAGVRLPRPVSPHLAAQLAGTSFNVEDVVAGFSRPDVGAAFRRPDPFWIVEGAGGVLVPLNDDELMIDVMVHLALPVVVVARTAVGTINHTLLTIEALRGRSLAVAGVIMSGPADAGAREAIERRGGVTVAELPVIAPLTTEALAAWADEAGASWTI
jgi:dethiobiotin synthase